MAALYGVLALCHFYGGQYAEQLGAAQRAADLARTLGDDGLLADAEHRRGLALLCLGQTDKARTVLDEAVRRADAVGNLECLSRALYDGSECYRTAGQFGIARRLLQVYAHLRAQQGEVRMARECREAAQVILQDLRGPLVRPSVH